MLPRRNRRQVKTSVSTSWGFAVVAGLAVVANSPVTVIPELGLWGTIISGGTLAAAGLLAAVGVISNRYRLEWLAAWVAAASLAPYLVVVWAVTLLDPTRLNQAGLVAALVGFIITRAMLCAAHAEKLRVVHRVGSGGIEAITTEGGSDVRGVGSGS